MRRKRADFSPCLCIELLQKVLGEFNDVLRDSILPWLKSTYAHAKPRPLSIVATRGIGESDIVTKLEQINFRPGPVDLGFYPAMGRVEIRLSGHPDHEAAVREAEQILRELLTDYLDPTPDCA